MTQFKAMQACSGQSLARAACMALWQGQSTPLITQHETLLSWRFRKLSKQCCFLKQKLACQLTGHLVTQAASAVLSHQAAQQQLLQRGEHRHAIFVKL